MESTFDDYFNSTDDYSQGTTSWSTASSLHPCDPRNPQELFNCSLKSYLHYMLGPQRLDLSTAVPITIVYVVIFFTGVVGNVAVCVVIVKHPSMHTATNYYLSSLAISDLTLLLLGLPNDLAVYWHQYPYFMGVGFCKFRALFSEAASYVSVLTIVAFSTERFLAICHPLFLYTMSGLTRAVRIIALLWFVSLICATPFAVYTTINYLNYPPNTNNKALESAFCGMLIQPEGWHLYETSGLLFFLFPMIIILYLYTRMGLSIRARTRHSLGRGVNGSVHNETRQAQSRKTIMRMLSAVVCAFFVCWAPFHVQRVLYIHGQDLEYYKELNEWLFSVAGWLYYVSCTMNPFLYNVMSNRYRVAFRETLCGKRDRNRMIREQSSFRETIVGSSSGYDAGHLVRVRSVMKDSGGLHRINTQRFSRYPPKEQEWEYRNVTSNSFRCNKTEQDTTKECLPTDVLVQTPTANGRTQCLPANSNHIVTKTVDDIPLRALQETSI